MALLTASQGVLIVRKFSLKIIAVNGKTPFSLGDHTRGGLIEWWSCICLQVVCRKLEKSVFLNSQIHGMSRMVGT